MKIKYLILALSLFCQMIVLGDNYRFQHIKSEQGLPHQQVEALLQDGKGNIWIGTRNGLAKYDGYGIKVYYHSDRSSNSLRYNFIKSLYLDSKKRIWVCTDRGICRYRPSTDDFRCYPYMHGMIQSVIETHKGKIICGGDQLCVYNERKDSFIQYPSLDYGFIISMAVDKRDNIYVATNSLIFCYNSSMTKITRLSSSYYSDFITGADGIIPMRFDKKGKLWIGRNGKGIEVLDFSTGKSKIFTPDDLSNGTVRVIAEDKSNRMWLGTEKGITIINPDGTKEIVQHHFQNPNGLSDNAIYSIICDNSKNVWIGSYFGGVDVLMHNNKQFLWNEPGYSAHNIKGKVARMIVETSPGVYWIATEDGGLNIYNAAQETFTVFNRVPNIGTNVHSLYFDRKNNEMWIGTFRNGLLRYNIKTGASKRYYHSNGLKSDAIFYFARQRNGRLWIATTQGLFYYQSSTDTFKACENRVLATHFVYTLYVDKKDNLWAGTTNQGLFCINSSTGRVTNWRKEGGYGLKDNYITSLYQSRNGIIWIGTNNNGLQYYNPKTRKFGSATNEILLSKCTICSLNEDRYGHLWISTSQGLYKYYPDTRAFVRFTTEDGLPTNQFNFSSSLLSQNGTMLFGTVNGLLSFQPSIMNKTAQSYLVHFKNLVIQNQVITAGCKNSPLTSEIDDANVLELSYDQASSFSIEYGAIMPGCSSSIEYQIYVEGLDKDWHNVGTERKFVGYNLQPGTYILHVRANNSNEGWNECPEKTITIIVNPPFYRSGWAYLFYFILFGALVYLCYRIFSARIRERNAVKIAQMEKNKIEEIDKAKFAFFTTVSHELKTPLSLIVAPLKSISRQELNKDSKKHLDMAIKNTQKMEHLINELVTFNKIETENFPFYIQKGNPLEFIEIMLTYFRESAAEKKLTLSVDCENNGEEVWFSPSYVERITNNLLSNALKFTPEGGKVAVKACITTVDDSPFTYLRIDVTDTGIGIAQEEQKNIFDRYYQTKRGYNVNNSGWGIGLSLVKRLVKVHKGKVSVDSEIGKGSAFTVLLNVSDDAFDAQCRINEDKVIVPVNKYKFSNSFVTTGMVEKDKTVNVTASDKISILIVDDNKDLLQFLYDYFSDKYNVMTAENGRDALNIAHNEPIQLIVSDVMMPEMDGIELCHTLKQDMATSHIPVILLTAKSESADVVTGYKSGAEAYVSKPFDPQILELQMNNIIQLQKARQTEIINAKEPDIDSTSLSQLDKDFMHKINELVEHNLGNSDFAIVDITRELGISRSLLHTKMKSLIDMSMGDYIRKKRLDKACIMLKDGFNVSETAYATGFSDPNYFSKTFKKNIGISPTEYVSSIK